MHDKSAPMSEAHNSSKDRIIDTVLQLWEEVGSTGLSVRMLSQTAAVPVSSIYHHFGSLEQLFVVAQEHACACATAWRDRHLHDLKGARMDRQAFGPLLAALIDDWAYQERRLAFAAREGQKLAFRSPHFQAAMARWNTIWTELWHEVCPRFGLENSAMLTARLFESESFLHMIRWRRVVDRAGLEEFARGWAVWLEGRPVPAAPHRDFARAEALREFPALPERDDTASRIAQAAAAIVSQRGTAALTHRAVAAEAGLTLGIVSHKFRTIAELMGAAFEALYLRNVSIEEKGGSDSLWSLNGVVGALERSASNFGPEELLLAVARDPSLRHFAAQLRYLRGRTSGPQLQAIFGPSRTVSPLEAALFSGFLSGQLRTHQAKPSDLFRSHVRQELEQLLGLVMPRGAVSQ
ncbi:TetR family transcriptional regulator [Sphingobium sp. EM0848]|uniref:TetR family transcriptional regulator n=1 Tax=Sphingobium sp. EM0848 TaxID=2743473 RepID=UPI0021009A12|nr:TetR family transcriptional regulator [Sphingobium sp. EM0848]